MKLVSGSVFLTQELAAEIQAAGGIVTAADLVDAQPTVKQPLQAEVHQHLSKICCLPGQSCCSQRSRQPTLARCPSSSRLTECLQVLGLTLLLPPPPSSGACVILALQILAGDGLTNISGFNLHRRMQFHPLRGNCLHSSSAPSKAGDGIDPAQSKVPLPLQ